MIICCAANRAAVDIQRSGFDANRAIALDQTAVDIDYASLRMIDSNTRGFHFRAIIDVDGRSALVRAVAGNSKRLAFPNNLAVNIQRILRVRVLTDKDSSAVAATGC